ncbi:hypothetical protein M231_05800 [Tremella mesenterica]|uniref:Uncharacterized protein n=1 Tax=Tremella mesenterica TaxID=5217 RepID=A0A4Q1BH91_TREME|nr:hypothetical protein M231_05800 [Tremella mesenterica]
MSWQGDPGDIFQQSYYTDQQRGRARPGGDESHTMRAAVSLSTLSNLPPSLDQPEWASPSTPLNFDSSHSPGSGLNNSSPNTFRIEDWIQDCEPTSTNTGVPHSNDGHHVVDGVIGGVTEFGMLNQSQPSFNSFTPFHDTSLGDQVGQEIAPCSTSINEGPQQMSRDSYTSKAAFQPEPLVKLPHDPTTSVQPLTASGSHPFIGPERTPRHQGPRRTQSVLPRPPRKGKIGSGSSQDNGSSGSKTKSKGSSKAPMSPSDWPEEVQVRFQELCCDFTCKIIRDPAKNYWLVSNSDPTKRQKITKSRDVNIPPLGDISEIWKLAALKEDLSGCVNTQGKKGLEILMRSIIRACIHLHVSGTSTLAKDYCTTPNVAESLRRTAMSSLCNSLFDRTVPLMEPKRLTLHQDTHCVSSRDTVE